MRSSLVRERIILKRPQDFSKAGATFDDISLFADHVGGNVKMKAAGGISSMEDAEKFLELGADRLGNEPHCKNRENGRRKPGGRNL